MTLLFQIPSTEEEWQKMAADFYMKWQFPHCLGAIDGKHISIQPPAHSGRTFYNYKSRFSVLMLAAVDASYQFRYVSVGAQGRASDGDIFTQSDLKEALDTGLLNIPSAKPLPGSNIEAPLHVTGR